MIATTNTTEATVLMRRSHDQERLNKFRQLDALVPAFPLRFGALEMAQP